ncbi:MAG: hypothetical protein QM639_15680 [Rhodocyclaceae bacterium]
MLDKVHGPAFPTGINELFAERAYAGPASALQEIVWALSRSIQYGAELREFTIARESLERSLLTDDSSAYNEALLLASQSWGESVWLIQNRLAGTLHWKGADEFRNALNGYISQISAPSLLSIILPFIAKRIESTALLDDVKAELAKWIEPLGNKDFDSYARAKIFELSTIRIEDFAPTLFFEAQSSLIDHYETLVLILQSAASRAMPVNARDAIARPLLSLYKRVGDRRLAGVLRAAGVWEDGIDYMDVRAEAIECYSKGDYRGAVEAATEWLDTTPDDMAAHVLRAKAAVLAGIQVPEQKGVLADLAQDISDVLNGTSRTYVAIFKFLSLAQRFYGQSWAHYLEYVGMYLIRPEQADFPSHWLKDIYVRDPYLTPFSAVAVASELQHPLLSASKLLANFPNTVAVYNAVAYGSVPGAVALSPERATLYLARHQLAFGQFELAEKNFLWLMEHSAHERIRSAGGAVLAFLGQGKLREATEAAVAAAFESPHVTRLLPTRELSTALAEPENWSDSIAVPLVFELINTNDDSGGISRLRYAFERFCESAGRPTPAELVSRSGIYGETQVINFLRRVWRPEVMRQTLLYDGHNEIEETRIRVCQVLAETDKGNAQEYLDEIKDRVKRIEIAKARTLVEQSKVCVDVEAIRKSVRSKLGDSYARYKGALSQAPTGMDGLISNLSEAVAGSVKNINQSLPMLLSNVHALDKLPTTESDNQFAALFTSITNEFLRGDHGLNAFLSTRVRHGALSNTLRKAVEDEHLVTSREADGGRYVRNSHWQDRLQDCRDEEIESVLDALDSFSQELDALISHIKDDLIQIKIVHELRDSGDNKSALFVYRTSNFERLFVQMKDRQYADIDDLVNYCIDTLWEKTDGCLAQIRDRFEKDILDKLMSIFDRLSEELARLQIDHPGEILSAIARARTETRQRLALVRSWFSRSEVFDRQDYSLDFPFNIALNMVTTTMSSAANWSAAQAIVRSLGAQMPGRTLDAMVYVFYGLLENAIMHSGLSADELWVKAELELDAGRFNLRIRNNISSLRPTADEVAKLSELRSSLQEFSRRAQSEGRSGIMKVWSAINAPMYRDPHLSFDYGDAEFFLEASFTVEGWSDESSAC